MNTEFQNFRYSKTHRIVLVLVSILILVRIFLPSYMEGDNRFVVKENIIDDLTAEAVELIQTDHTVSTNIVIAKNKKKKIQKLKPSLPSVAAHSLDLNLASTEELISIGLSKKVAYTISKYKKKGGQFYKSSDLMKIYGVDSTLYAEVKSYLKVDKKKSEKKYTYKKEGSQKEEDYVKSNETNTNYSNKYNKKPKRNTEIYSANNMSYENLISLKGIGPVYAKRILKYRDKLGGFTNLNQLAEVYGLKDSVTQLIAQNLTFDTLDIVKLKVNKITFKEILRHPYIEYNQVKIIVNYRKQHGKYKTIKDILKSNAFEENEINKIKPYLSFEE